MKNIKFHQLDLTAQMQCNAMQYTTQHNTTQHTQHNTQNIEHRTEKIIKTKLPNTNTKHLKQQHIHAAFNSTQLTKDTSINFRCIKSKN